MTARATTDIGELQSSLYPEDEPNAFGEIDEPLFNFWDRAVEAILIALLAFAPAALGAVQPWSELVVLALAAALPACLLVKLVRDRRRWRPAWTWAYVPIALFLLLVAAQLVRLPSGAVGKFSPHTVRLKQDLLGDLPDAGGVLQHVAVTFCPAATRHDLALVLAAAAVFVTVSATYRTARQIRRLLAAVAVIGGAFALLALVQDATRADAIYWQIPLPPGGRADAGPFVNHSHFAQFMNLSVGAALGLMLVKLEELSRDVGGRIGVRATLASWRYDGRVRAVIFLGITVVLGLLAVALSMSRGGVLSALVAGAVTFAAVTLMSRRRAGSPRARSAAGPALAIIGLVAFCVLLYFGYDAVHERFASQGEALERADAGRMQILRDLRQIWALFPLAGTGLGTHRFVFPMFDRSGLTNLAAHAENEYAQLMEEVGGVGLALAVVFIAIVAAAWFRAARGRRSIHVAAFGLGYGLLAILVHSASDFGQHIPANACLTATVCGLLIVLTRIEGRRKSRREPAPPPPADVAPAGPPRWPTAMIATGILAGTVVFLPNADAARRADEHWTEARRIEAALRSIDWQGNDDDYSALIAEAQEAAALQPADVEFAYGLSLYRWQSIARPMEEPLEESRVQEFAVRIVDDLNAARRLAPTFGPPCTLAGEIELFSLGESRREVGRAHVRQGYRLSPQDPVAALVVGRMEAVDGNLEASLSALRRAIRLDPRLTPEVVKTYLDDINRPDLAIEFAGDDAFALFRLADELTRRKADPDLIATARSKAVKSLRARCDGPDATAGELSTMAAICQKDGDFPAAIVYWRHALVLQLTNASWRLQLAQCYLQSGDRASALKEAETVLRTQPRNAEAEKLVESLKDEK